MTVDVHIHQGPLPSTAPPCCCTGAGAVVTFEGRVRGLENGQPISALDYEVYDPMARETLRRIAEELVARHALAGMCVEHSGGRVGVGECSFRLQVAALHRQEVLGAMALYIDRMKQDVPIWKTPVA